jgi:hypothetical protein
MAFLVHPDNPGTESQINEHQAAAHKLGLRLHVLRASSEGDLDAAFANLHQLAVEGLVIGPDSFFNTVTSFFLRSGTESTGRHSLTQQLSAEKFHCVSSLRGGAQGVRGRWKCE